MGWTDDIDGSHEGYLVAVIKNDGQWRELGSGDDEQEVKRVQVACDCGWRTTRIMAPLGTRFFPSIVVVRDYDEKDFTEEARKLWRAHIAEMRTLIAAKLYYENGITLPVHEARRARLGL